MKRNGSFSTGDSCRELAARHRILLMGSTSLAPPDIFVEVIIDVLLGAVAMTREGSGGFYYFPARSVWLGLEEGSPAFDLMYVIPKIPIPLWERLNQPPKGPGHGGTGGNRSHQSGTSHRRQR